MMKMRILNGFFKNIRGNVAITFGLAAVPAVMLTGMVVDYSKSTWLQGKLQRAADVAGVAAAASGSEDVDKIGEIIKKYVDRNRDFDKKQGKYTVTPDLRKDGSVEVAIKLEMKTTMLRVVGIDKLDVVAKTLVKRDYGNMHVALVLDNTGSMAGRKMYTLKQSAKELVETVFKAKSKTSEIKIGLVPFADYVNIGMQNRTKSWANIPNDSYRREKRTRWRRKVIGKYNCRWRTRYYYRDGVRRSYRYRSCSYRYGKPYRQTYWQTIRTRWYGCVGSRNYPWNTRDERPSYKIPGIMNRSCSRALTELTTDKAKILREINAMNDSGATYIPAGLMWGWRVVSDAVPFTSGVSKDKPQKAIVLMTDGENTVSPTYPDHRGGSTTLANKLTTQICQNIKKSTENITIYTVAFEVHDVKTKAMLRDCATSPSHYFDASNSAKLSSSFQKIAKSLASLRIAE